MALSIASPAFDHGDPIPREYGYTEANVSPPLDIGGVPDAAASLAIVVDDPDAVEPAGKVWDHWVVWNVDPEIGRIPEDWDAAGATEGRNDYGEAGYGGPNPPDREHTYRFVCYALSDRLDLPDGATKADLEVAMEGLVLDEAILEGSYAP
ncbi:MAG: YbhB/YbcL family Raf kinase inhibitor-like protein [Haloarculaceae archaeon]